VTITAIRNNERRNISSAELETVRGVVIEARATFFDNVKRRAIYNDKVFRGDAQYDISQGSDGENRAIQQAIEKLTNEILLETVAGW
jgi:hypothetical protein